jgi:hypothetical protein
MWRMSWATLISTLKLVINNSSKCLTISSKNNESNFLNTLDSNIVDHNITTFSLIQ